MRSLFVGSVTAACLGVALTLAWKYALPIPFWDEWLWVPYATGDAPVTMEWLWEPYNEHRLPLPKGIYLLWAWMTDMDGRALAIGSTLAFGGLAVASIVLARRLRGRTSYLDVFFPLLLLHGTHLENLTWPFQIGFVLPAGMTILALFLVIGKRPVGVGICLLVLSLCGPVGLPVVILLSPWVIHRGRSIVATILSSAALVLSLLYFIGLERPEAVVPSPSLRASIVAGVKCLSTGIGQRAEDLWPVSGILVVVLVGVAFLQVRKARAWGIGLVLLGLCGLALGVGHVRAGFGSASVFVFRYSTIICPVLWIAYVATLLGDSRSRSQGVRVLLVAMAGALFWPNTEQWVDKEQERHGSGQALLEEVRTGRSVDDLADRHWRDWNPEWRGFARGMEMLARARKSVYRRHVPVPGTGRVPAIWTARTLQKGSPDSGDGVRTRDGSWALYAHPHSVFSLPVPHGVSRIRVSFGILEGGYLNGGATDGVLFRVLCQRASGTPDLVGSRLLEPLEEPGHRGTQQASFDLGRPLSAGDEIVLETLPGPRGDPAWDWAYWAGIEYGTSGP